MTTEQVHIAKLETKILLLMNKLAELEEKNASREKELLYYRTKKVWWCYKFIGIKLILWQY